MGSIKIIFNIIIAVGIWARFHRIVMACSCLALTFACNPPDVDPGDRLLRRSPAVTRALSISHLQREASNNLSPLYPTRGPWGKFPEQLRYDPEMVGTPCHQHSDCGDDPLMGCLYQESKPNEPGSEPQGICCLWYDPGFCTDLEYEPWGRVCDDDGARYVVSCCDLFLDCGPKARLCTEWFIDEDGLLHVPSDMPMCYFRPERCHFGPTTQ